MIPDVEWMDEHGATIDEPPTGLTRIQGIWVSHDEHHTTLVLRVAPDLPLSATVIQKEPL